MPRTRAFSLVELLVALGVIALLLAIALPAIRAARGSAQTVVVLSNLRGVGATFAAYSDANRGLYPFIEPGSVLRIAPPGEQAGQLSTSDPWVARYAWATLMHEVAPWREHYTTWISPGREVNPEAPWRPASGSVVNVWPSYSYSNAFVADPAVWSGGAVTQDNVRAQAVSATAHPSGKVLVFDHDRAYLPPDAGVSRRAVLMCDGSAAMRWDSDARPPVENPLRDGDAWLYHDTARGLLGVDF